MARTKRGVLRKAVKNIEHEVERMIQGIRKLKDRLTGRNWRRAHRIESELETIAGKKGPVKRPFILGTLPTHEQYAKMLAENKKLKEKARKSKD